VNGYDAARAGIDRSILSTVLLLLLFGLVMMYSSSAILAASYGHGTSFFLGRQILRTLLGIGCLLAVSRIGIHRLQGRAAWTFFGFTLFLLLLCLVPNPLRVTVRGTHRWISLGFITIQPADFARLSLVLLLAHMLSRSGPDGIATLKGLWKPVAPIGVVVGMIVLQPNLGSAIAIGLLGAFMLWIGGIRIRHLLAGAAAACVVLAVWLLASDYHMKRLTEFVTGASATDPLGAGYQLRQSKLALGSGGIFGQGIGHGLQKFFFLPDAHTDFIFSIIGEEVGFVGCALVLGAFLFLLARCVRVTRDAPDRFTFLLAGGLTASIGIYVLVNIGVATGVLPTTGLPLPFISYGGSSVISHLIAVGVLLGISSQTRRPSPTRAWRR
jgi:cell division protein FtsW